MRRRRHNVQVSTFPFLAVLLCTMGSLILLMLVIDRRARAVARAKAMHALAQTSAAETEAAEARRAEWERRRRLLHEQLAEQNDEILTQLSNAKNEETRLAGAISAELAGVLELNRRLQAEQVQLAKWEMDLTVKRNEFIRATRETEASQTELARLSAELNRVERTLADLKEARLRNQQTYSVVPYRGKRGDQRKPIYVECTAAALVFHPERRMLQASPFLAAALFRNELDQRLAARRRDTTSIGDKQDDNAYLLFLVRPDGITTYYRATAALQSSKMDFGYEFIDQDWVLDFPEDDSTPAGQSWMTAQNNAAPPSNKGTARRVTGIQPSQIGNPRFETATGTVGSGSPPAQSVGGPLTSSTQRRGPPGGNDSGRVPSVPDSDAIPSPLVITGGPRGTSGGVASGRYGGAPGPGSSPGSNSSPAFNGEGLAGTSGQSATGLGGSGMPGALATTQQDAPAVGLGFPRVIPSSGSSESTLAGTAGRSQALVTAARNTSPDNVGAPSQNATVVAQPGNVQGSAQAGRSDSSGGNSQGQGASSGLLPALAPSQSNNVERSAAQGSQDAAGQGQASAAPHGTGTEGEPGRPIPRDPLAGLGPKDRQTKAARSVAPRPTLLNGNRDWFIPLECTAEALLVGPARQRIMIASLARGENGNSALLEAVQQLIARRQATVRSGESPYRPMIRFRVHADGLRSYYLAYPALEALGVPMSRENLEPDEDSKMKGSK